MLARLPLLLALYPQSMIQQRSTYNSHAQSSKYIEQQTNRKGTYYPSYALAKFEIDRNFFFR